MNCGQYAVDDIHPPVPLSPPPPPPPPPPSVKWINFNHSMDK